MVSATPHLITHDLQLQPEAPQVIHRVPGQVHHLSASIPFRSIPYLVAEFFLQQDLSQVPSLIQSCWNFLTIYQFELQLLSRSGSNSRSGSHLEPAAKEIMMGATPALKVRIDICDTGHEGLSLGPTEVTFTCASESPGGLVKNGLLGLTAEVLIW